MTVTVRVRRLPHADGLPLPRYETAGAAGLDLLAALPPGDSLGLSPLGRVLVPTGLVLELPPGFEGQVRPRSGWAVRSGVTVLNSPGTIDADFRGEVRVLLINLGDAPVAVERGMRIAQLVIAPVTTGELVEVEELGTTARASRGFGSTGL